jgi:hypothetical protein
MNTQVNSEAPAAAAQAAPVVAVAETAPVALTPVAAAVAAPATAAVAARKSLADDFLDTDDEPVTNAAPAQVVAEAEEETAEENEIIPDLEDDASDTVVSADGEEGSDLQGLEDLDEVVEEEQSMVVIDVFKKKCTDCTHLVPWGTKTHKRCHFSNGNELCPAQSVRIRRYIPVDQIVTRFLAAESQGDTKRLIALYANLEAKATDVQEEIHAALKAAREKKVLKSVEPA